MQLPTIRVSKKKIILLVLIAISISLLFFLYQQTKSNRSSLSGGYMTAHAETRDISVRLNAAAPLQPADSYTITTLVDGTILSASLAEGGIVSKGQLLYQINGKLTSGSMSSATSSVEQA